MDTFCDSTADFLASTDVVDWFHPDICALAWMLASGVEGAEHSAAGVERRHYTALTALAEPVAHAVRVKHPHFEIARRCFEWVRDEIEHSIDFRRSEVTCRASEVLRQRTGFCYAKSHLLAALLRANGVPTGFCYQRLSIDGSGPPYCLHGLNAVLLPEFGWYRVDARGNRAGDGAARVDAQFTPPAERLAFAPAHEGEEDLPGVYAEPLDVVVDVLVRYDSVGDVTVNLPDVAIAAEDRRAVGSRLG